MATISLTLDSLKFANVYGFSRDYGTKKDSATNGGSLTTKEFNEANALPFDLQRPVEINETTTTSEIQYDAKVNITATSLITLTIGSSSYIGLKLDVYNSSAVTQSLEFNSKLYSLESGEKIELIWNGTSWTSRAFTKTFTEFVGTLMVDGGDIATATYNIDVTTPGLLELYDGLTLRLYFKTALNSSVAMEGVTLNINELGAKTIKAPRSNSLIAMTSHQMTAGADYDADHAHRFCDKGTKLELVYDATNDCFVADPDALVMSYSSDTQSYSVKANGWIEQYGYFGDTSVRKQYTVNLTVLMSEENYYISCSAYAPSSGSDDTLMYKLNTLSNKSFNFYIATARYTTTLNTKFAIYGY